MQSPRDIQGNMDEREERRDEGATGLRRSYQVEFRAPTPRVQKLEHTIAEDAATLFFESTVEEQSKN